ncbi:MAG TPA: class I SAM-dependent methyltransferase [Candidatus Polarisedimenticolia bacterium]|nr:class I SAM-dependent methyltransferase [Candidatus Polarisedimenticolia bacterium]
MSRVRDVFDDWARSGRAEGMERGHAPAARAAFERLGLTATSRYLDIGCGNGYTVRWAAAAAPRGLAVGVDLSEAMIERASALSEGIPNVRFAAGDFLTVTPPGAPFDAVFSMEVLYYLPGLQAGLERVRGLLVPGGLFACVVDYYTENPASHSWPDDLGVPMTLLSAEGWAAAFRRAGLDLVSQERLRHPAGEGVAAWKLAEGSLFTLGRRPRRAAGPAGAT